MRVQTAGTSLHPGASDPIAFPRVDAARAPVVAVVIPCYRVRAQILSVLQGVGSEATLIFVIDDACPDGSGMLVSAACRDPRVVVVRHAENQGVGGAVMTGYRLALAAGADVIVKIDGDGQMDPALIGDFVRPIVQARADYVKGNRFFNIEDVAAMPLGRLIGNAGLSFLTKLSSGYWSVFDPTNGYTAIGAAIASHLPLHKIQRRYFFESDMLFRLGTLQAQVVDLPMRAIYGEEKSGLNAMREILPFLLVNYRNFTKRLFYSYFLRGFSAATVQLLVGLVFLAFGVTVGVTGWTHSIESHVPATAGTVILAALPIILGVQLLLSFLAFDWAAEPRRTLSPYLSVKQPDDPEAGIAFKTRCLEQF